MGALLPESIFVFGSNLAGRHGAGAALAAARWHGARYGQGEGRTGNAYAIPTKGRALQVLSLVAIKAAVDRFKDYAAANPDLSFTVTRIGCGLAGHRDDDVAPFFSDAPGNCDLPYLWQMKLGFRADHRIIVAGTRTFADYPFLAGKLDSFFAALPVPPTIVSGCAPGADRLGERYAKDRGLSLLQFPADWRRFGNQAGPIRNQQMGWASSDLIAFWDGRSRGTRNMIGVARTGGLGLRRVLYGELARVA